MPCVLPVLSLKLLSIMKHGGGEKNVVRKSFLMTTLGILTSFMFLALVIIGLKSAGHAVGWGFHFQEPTFLISLIIIINIFAANQWSLFEINLPAWLGGSIEKASRKHDAHSNIGNFVTGAFATLMATPCSAPFIGTAISFALTQSPWEILIIFFSMGLGLALPYVLFICAPNLITKLPKPGNWMIKLKYILGGLLFITSLWLISVLYGQTGILSSLVVILMSMCSIILLILYKRFHFISQLQLLLIIILGIGLTVWVPTIVSKTKQITENKKASDLWIPFNEQSIHRYVAEGKIVFVDITADWCLTCKVNKWHVLENEDIIHLLKQENVIAMMGDLSSPNPIINDYLKRNGRYGIPFNMVYGANAPKGIALSELLSKEMVIDAFKKAQ